MKTEAKETPHRLYNDLGAMNEAGTTLWASIQDGAETLAQECSKRNLDLRDARQIACDAMSDAFARRIIREAQIKGFTPETRPTARSSSGKD